MNHQERLDLNRLLNSSDYVDNTEMIRRVKPSKMMIESLRDMELLKRKHRDMRAEAPEEFAELCKNELRAMYDAYPDIFNRQLKDELNLAIMIRLLRVLEQVENGAVDQAEGSVMVGKYLKELYVDSALRRADNLDKEHAAETPAKVEGKTISWKEWKRQNM